MNTLIPFISFIALTTAIPTGDNWDSSAYAPATIIDEGPWVEEPLFDSRGPKQIASTPATSPTSFLGQLSSFWTWDR